MRSSGGVKTYARLATCHEQSPPIFCRTASARGCECLDYTTVTGVVPIFFFFLMSLAPGFCPASLRSRAKPSLASLSHLPRLFALRFAAQPSSASVSAFLFLQQLLFFFIILDPEAKTGIFGFGFSFSSLSACAHSRNWDLSLPIPPQPSSPPNPSSPPRCSEIALRERPSAPLARRGPGRRRPQPLLRSQSCPRRKEQRPLLPLLPRRKFLAVFLGSLHPHDLVHGVTPCSWLER